MTSDRTTSRTLSIHEARRLALAAQGFMSGGRRPSLRATIERLGVLQLDSVNVLTRAHYMPAFSRGGAYDRAALDALAWGGEDGKARSKRALFEYWGHEASLLPFATQPLLRWRMARAERGEGIWGGVARFGRERRALCEEVVREIEARGPSRASELAASTTPAKKIKASWWTWSDAKRALEWLFWSGRVTTATRRHFERVYDLPERVLPPEILALPTPTVEEAQRALIGIAARALGVATESDLRDYFRLKPDARPRVAELVESGALEEVAVEGWPAPAYVARGARVPRPFESRALVSPFDPIVWNRARALRLFDFHYRIEIYTPAHRREHGYYVLPFLLGDRLVARVDLKGDRAARTLEVRGAGVESHVAPADVAAPLAAELRALAAWLALDDVVVVTRRGRLAPALRAELRRR